MDENQNLDDHLGRLRDELTATSPSPDSRIEALLTGTPVDHAEVVALNDRRAQRRNRFVLGAIAAAMVLLAGSAVFLNRDRGPAEEVATTAAAPLAIAADEADEPTDDSVPGAPDDAPSTTAGASDKDTFLAEQNEWLSCVKDTLDEAFDKSLFSEDGHWQKGPIIFGFDEECGEPPFPEPSFLPDVFGCDGDDCRWPAPFDIGGIEECITTTSPIECISLELDLDLPFGDLCKKSDDAEAAPWPCFSVGLPEILDCAEGDCSIFDLPSPWDCKDDDSTPCFGIDSFFDEFPKCLKDDSCDFPGSAVVENCAAHTPGGGCWKITIGTHEGSDEDSGE